MEECIRRDLSERKTGQRSLNTELKYLNGHEAENAKPGAEVVFLQGRIRGSSH